MDFPKENKAKALLSDTIKGKTCLPQITDKTEREIIKSYIKVRIATFNPVYYPFFINLPLKQVSQKVVCNNEEKEREWFYWEIEIVSRLGYGLNFVIGMLQAPTYHVDKAVEDDQSSILRNNPDLKSPILNPEKVDSLPQELEDVSLE